MTAAPAASSPPGSLTPQVHLGRTILSAVLVSLTLKVLAIVLTLPGDIGPEEYLRLGAVDTGLMNDVSTAWWHLVIAGPVRDGLSLVSAAVAYFALDTALLVTPYGWLLFEMTRGAAETARARGSRVGRLAAQALAYLTAVLLAIDVLENSSALTALEASTLRILFVVIGAAALVAGALYAHWRLKA